MSPLDFQTHTSEGASVVAIPGGYRLSIPGTNSRQYRLAQLDDYSRLPRRKFPHRSIRLRLKAKASANSLPGTWGFGLWNDPFGLNLGFTGSDIRLPALPNAAWFFHASSRNYLSFRDDKPAQGFLAQTFLSRAFDWRLVRIAFNLPFRRKLARQLLSSVIQEDGKKIDIDPTNWQEYQLTWNSGNCVFHVNRQIILDTNISPKPPLGLVIWIDNQFAAFTPQGKLEFGIEAYSEPAWLEIKDLEIEYP